MGTSVGWKESHIVANCNASKNETTKVYEFSKRVCKKTMGAGVQQLQAQRQRDKQQLIAALSPGDWMLFESPQLDDEPLWLGRAVSNPAWGNACVWKNETTCTNVLRWRLPSNQMNMQSMYNGILRKQWDLQF